MFSQIFNHIAVAEDANVLRQVRDNPAINAAIHRNSIGEKARSYLASLSKEALKFSKSEEEAHTYLSVNAAIGFTSELTLDEVKAELRHGFPETDGFDEFALTIYEKIQNFMEASEYQEGVAHFVVSLPGFPGFFHRDNGTDLRGFLALRSKGPFIARTGNPTVYERYPGKHYNNFGHFDEVNKDPDNATQMQEGDFGVWKGDVHDMSASGPAYHCIYDVDPDEFRLSMMINPTNDEYTRMLAKLGLKHVYVEPVFE